MIGNEVRERTDVHSHCRHGLCCHVDEPKQSGQVKRSVYEGTASFAGE